ncbi:MAG: hypothetical protein ACRDQZ_11020 [Mycobacteriales bacterium]
MDTTDALRTYLRPRPSLEVQTEAALRSAAEHVHCMWEIADRSGLPLSTSTPLVRSHNALQETLAGVRFGIIGAKVVRLGAADRHRLFVDGPGGQAGYVLPGKATGRVIDLLDDMTSDEYLSLYRDLTEAGERTNSPHAKEFHKLDDAVRATVPPLRAAHRVLLLSGPRR